MSAETMAQLVWILAPRLPEPEGGAPAVALGLSDWTVKHRLAGGTERSIKAQGVAWCCNATDPGPRRGWNTARRTLQGRAIWEAATPRRTMMAHGQAPIDTRQTAPTEPTTRALDVPGAALAYDVRVNATTTEPVLLLIGAPMAAGGFAALADQFPDRTVVTYDPRGSERSRLADPSAGTTPQEHADDLHRLIAALDAGPVDVFASSGGAVNALELVARHPEQVRTLVAHEPPALAVLPDRDAALAANVAVHETYLRSGAGPAMAQFIALATLEGPVPADFASRPAPDPAAFGLPTADDGSRDHPLLGRHMISSSHYEPDFDALRAAQTHIVVGVGAESGNTVAGRGAKAVAERLGTAPVTFPGGHDGFVGGERHPAGQPEAFAATLRRVLAGER